MANGYALTISVSQADAKHYGTDLGWPVAEKSTGNIGKILEKQDFDWKHLSNKQATYRNVFEHLWDYAKKLKPKDIICIYFCGHGVSVKKTQKVKGSGYEDEGWCLYDRVLFHFELWALARKFKKGVKVVVLSDACFSGTLGFDGEQESTAGFSCGDSFIEENKLLYEAVLTSRSSVRVLEHEVEASIITMSSASEDEISQVHAMQRVTLFAYAMKKSWSKSKTGLNYHRLYDDLRKYIDKYPDKESEQRPRWHYVQGRKNISFPKQKAFSIQ